MLDYNVKKSWRSPLPAMTYPTLANGELTPASIEDLLIPSRGVDLRVCQAISKIGWNERIGGINETHTYCPWFREALQERREGFGVLYEYLLTLRVVNTPVETRDDWSEFRREIKAVSGDFNAIGRTILAMIGQIKDDDGMPVKIEKTKLRLTDVEKRRCHHDYLTSLGHTQETHSKYLEPIFQKVDKAIFRDYAVSLGHTAQKQAIYKTKYPKATFNDYLTSIGHTKSKKIAYMYSTSSNKRRQDGLIETFPDYLTTILKHDATKWFTFYSTYLNNFKYNNGLLSYIGDEDKQYELKTDYCIEPYPSDEAIESELEYICDAVLSRSQIQDVPTVLNGRKLLDSFGDLMASENKYPEKPTAVLISRLFALWILKIGMRQNAVIPYIIDIYNDRFANGLTGSRSNLPNPPDTPPATTVEQCELDANFI